MSNPLITNSSFAIREMRDKYLELIADGGIESQALEISGLKKSTYIRLLLDDADFAKQVELARKHRAEHWVSKIANGVDEHYDKDETPGAKLIFDKLVYLAKADNPDRYGGSGKGVNVNINMGEFKLLSPEDAKKALASDPFALEAEYTEIQDDNGEELL